MENDDFFRKITLTLAFRYANHVDTEQVDLLVEVTPAAVAEFSRRTDLKTSGDDQEDAVVAAIVKEFAQAIVKESYDGPTMEVTTFSDVEVAIGGEVLPSNKEARVCDFGVKVWVTEWRKNA